MAHPVTPQMLYAAAQNPAGWFFSARRLRDAAEIILQHEVAQEIPYGLAYEEASREAIATAWTGTNEAGHAEIKCVPPNYMPAQLLYAFAIENLLKGLIMANNPGLAGEEKISKSVKSHDLLALAEQVGVEIAVQEVPVLKSLSDIAIWAGRYPVAARREEHEGKENPNRLLDWGSQHPIMRAFFNRAADELKSKLRPDLSFYDVVVSFRPPV